MDGSVQGKYRPVIVVQNDIGNTHSTVTNVIPLTSFRFDKKQLPTHVIIEPSRDNGLINKSIALVEQIRTIPSDKLEDEIGCLEDCYWPMLYGAMLVQFPFLNACGNEGEKSEESRKSRRSASSYQDKAFKWVS